jgi:hypothetical protein
MGLLSKIYEISPSQVEITFFSIVLDLKPYKCISFTITLFYTVT